MPLPTKFFKVTLPLTTAATATIITAYLVSSFTKELNEKKEEDQVLENIELKAKEFEEELIQNNEGLQKDKKSVPSKEEKKKDKILEEKSPEKSKEKQETSVPEDVAKALIEAENAITQLANKQGGPGETEKQLKIESQGKVSQAEGPETTANSHSDSEQSVDPSSGENLSAKIPKDPQEEEVKVEPRDGDNLKETPLAGQDVQEENTQAPSSGSPQEIEKESPQDLFVRAEDIEPKSTDDTESSSEETQRGEINSEDDGNVSESGREGVNDSESEEGASEINEETMKRLVALSSEMSDYKGKLQGLIRSIK